MKHLPDNFRWSFSKLAGYIQCPRSFYLTYIEDEREPLSNYFAEIGSWCHSLLEAWAKDEIPSFCLAEEFASGYDDHVKMAPPPWPKGLGEKGYQQCLDYFENFDGFGDEWEVVTAEEKFVINYQGYDISGIADLVLQNKETGAVRIVDHKTKSQASMQKEITLYRKQLYLYAHWWIMTHEGEPPQDLVFNMIKTNELIIEPFSWEEYGASMNWFVDTIEQIKTADVFEDWGCNISKFFCGNLCDCFQSCQEWLDFRQADYQKWLAKKQAEEELTRGY